MLQCFIFVNIIYLDIQFINKPACAHAHSNYFSQMGVECLFVTITEKGAHQHCIFPWRGGYNKYTVNFKGGDKNV